MMELKAGYKQTDVGVIPEDWEVCHLSEAVDFLDGQRRPIKSSERAKVSGTYPYYGASGIIDYVNDYIFDDKLILLGEDGENILSRNLPLAFQVNGKIWVNNHAHVLKPKENFDICFLTNYLENLDYSLLNSGTAQPKLNKNTCLKIKIAKPSKIEQTAIATALSDTDALISSLEKLIVKKRNIKQGAMQTLLQPKEGWEVKTFKDVTELITCGIAATPNYVSEAKGFPFLSSTNIKNGKIQWSNYKFISKELHGQLFRNNPPMKGDVLYSRVGTIGEAAVVDVDFEFSVYVSLTLIKVGKLLHNKFLVHILNSAEYKKLANNTVLMGGGVGNLNVSVVRAFPIPIPPMEEQTQIATILSDMDAEITALETKLAKIKAIKLGMMQNLLTGNIRLI